MCMMLRIQPTAQQRLAAQSLAAASAATRHHAATDALHTHKDPRGYFAASVLALGKPKVPLTREQEASLRSRLGADDGSPSSFLAFEAHYGIEATELPVRQSLPATGGRDYTSITEQIKEVKQRSWDFVLQGNTDAEREQLSLLHELRGEAAACFPGESNLVFGSGMRGAALYTVEGRPNALENTRRITKDGLPRLDVVSLTTPVEVVESGTRGKGAATRSAGSAAGGHMRGQEHSWAKLPEVPVMHYDNGVQSFTVHAPRGVATMRACEQELLYYALELDAALQARGEEPQHVKALQIAMQQVAACEQMYRTMEEAGKSWKACFPLILSVDALIMLDDGALSAFYDERVDSLVFNLMPPGSDVSTGISYVAVHHGTACAPPCMPVPCMDKHLGDDKFPKKVPGPNIDTCIFAPPGLVAQGKLGGTFVQEEDRMRCFVNPTLGEHLEVLSALGKSTTMDPVNHLMHATAPVVLKEKSSMGDTKIFCSKVFSGDIKHSVLTLGKVVCGERYSNVKRDEDSMVLNESFDIELCPVHAPASTGTSPLFKDQVGETSGASQFHNLTVVDSTHDGASCLYEGACQSSFTVQPASARAGRVALPKEHSKCFFGTDEKGKVRKLGFVRPGSDNSHWCAHEHLPALCKVLLNPQSAFRLPNGTMMPGHEGLRAALDVSTLGELMYLGIFETVQEAHTITVRQHDGRDDETGEPVDMSQAKTVMCGSTPCFVLPVPSDMLLKTTVKAGRTPIDNFRCVYLLDTGEEEPENEDVKLKAGESYELPFPSQFTSTDSPDGWRTEFAPDSKLQIFFHVQGSNFQPSTWGDKCCMPPPPKRRKM